jgi:hypothetical protein
MMMKKKKKMKKEKEKDLKKVLNIMIIFLLF